MNKQKTDKQRISKDNDNSKIESKRKAPLWFYVVMFFIPILFVVILEFSLRLFNYGYDFEVFLPASEYHYDKYFTNPDIPYKYFYNIKAAPSVLPDGFDIEKKKMLTESLYWAKALLPGGLMCLMLPFPVILKEN